MAQRVIVVDQNGKAHLGEGSTLRIAVKKGVDLAMRFSPPPRNWKSFTLKVERA